MHNTKLSLIYKNGEYVIQDSMGNIIINDIHDVDVLTYENYSLFRFFTNEGEFSCITSSGFFFREYSYLDYDAVSKLIDSKYKIKKANKFGILDCGTNKIDQECVYDEVRALASNDFMYGASVKIKHNKKYFIINYHNNKVSKEYDFIYTPIQPLDKFIVCLDGQYGFISSDMLVEISDISFHDVEELCKCYMCNVNKYTEDIYRVEDLQNWDKYSNIIDKNNPNIVSLRTGEIYSYYLKKYAGFNKGADIWLNIYGYFYDLFDSRIYDLVIYAIGRFYVVLKDGNYGIVDDEFHVVLDLAYRSIKLVYSNQLSQMPLFVVSSENGDCLFNVVSGMKTSYYDSISFNCYDNYLTFEMSGKYGLIDIDGRIILDAKYDLMASNANMPLIEQHYPHFYAMFHSAKYSFYVKDDKFYGIVPIEKYDCCIRIQNNGLYGNYYVASKNGKFFLLNYLGNEFDLPPSDDLFFGKYNSVLGLFNLLYIKPIPISYTFIVGRVGQKYSLYSIKLGKDSNHAEMILSDCDEMEIIEEQNLLCSTGYEWPYVHFINNCIEGYVNEFGEIISIERYDDIKPIKVDSSNKLYYLVYKSNRVGLLDSRRRSVLPCNYDDIIKVYETYAIIIQNGDECVVYYDLSDSSISEDGKYSLLGRQKTYTKYTGSYAQYVMDYTDDDIDDVFDGDPDAYWNID